jgi:hypothetical protein
LDLKYNASNPAGYQTAAQVSTALAPYITSSTATSSFYPLTGNPSSFLTSAAFSPYLLSSTAASTYQTLSGMSSYLTTSAAAAGYYPLSGNPSGFLTSASLSGYATESFVTSQGYITSAALTPYLTKADNLASVASVSAARTNLGLGSVDTPTFAGVTAQGSGANVANLTPTSLSLNHATSGSFVIQPSVGITFPNGSVQTTAFTGIPSAYISSVSSPLSVSAGNLSIDLSAYLTTATAASTYQTQSGMSDYLAKAGNLAGLASTSAARTNLGLGSLAVVNDAPSDGSQYARKNGAWDVVTATSSYITSASSPLSVTSGNLTIDLSAYAPLNAPVFTGDARAVTPAFGDNDTSIATTAFVQSALAGGTAVARNLEVEVRNQSGSTIAAGSIVYISGATGNKPLITLAQANNDANSAQTIGFVKTSIANNGTGYVIVRGELENIDTSALTEGVQLYLSPTTAGTWTTTKPSAPQHLVYVGIVIRSHPTLGTILVAVQNGYELGETHDVELSSLANNNLLAYESSTDLWKNKTYSALGLLTSADAASTYRALSNNTFANIGVNSGGAITINDGGIYPNDVFLDNRGLEIRNGTTFVQVAAFKSDGVILPSSGLTFSDATTQTTAGISSATVASTYQTISGMSAYAPKASPALTGNVTINSNSTGAALFIEQSGTGNILTLHDQASDTSFVAIDQNGKVNTIPSVTASAGFNVPHATAAPTTPVNGDIWTTTAGLFYQINGATVSPATLAGGTYTGRIITAASTTAGSGFRIPNGVAPTTPTLGDVWLVSGAAGSIVFQGNGTQTVATLGYNQTFSGNNIFSGATSTFGNSTAAATYNIGTGATLTATTKTVNIGTAGTSGSTTAVNIGSAVSGATSTVNVNALLISRASTATEAGLRILPGTAPSAPVNGDIWTETTGVFARINGATQSLVAPAIATVAQTNNPSSNTTAMSPDKARQMMMFQGFQQFLGGGSVGTSGTGAVAPSTSARWRQFQGPNVSTAGYSAFVFDLLNSSIGFVGSKRGANEYGKNYARAFWMSGRTLLGTDDGGFGGDVNNLYRCELGGRNNIATNGDPTNASLGWRVAGGGSQAIVFYMRSRTAVNGGTYSETTTSFSPVFNQWFDWMVTYNGTDTCQMFVNDTLVGTISANFTGFQGEHYNFYSERIEQTATSATRLEVNTLPPRIYFSE